MKVRNPLIRRSVQAVENRPAFLGRLSVLLQEGYTFHDGLVLLLPYHSKHFSDLLERVEKDLKAGLGVTDILMNLGFPSHTLLPVFVAEVDGRLAEALKGIADRMRQSEERRKKLRNLLLYPITLFFFLTIFLFVFRTYFIPNLQAMTLARKGAENGFSSLLPLLVSRIPDAMIGCSIFLVCIVGSGLLIYRRLSTTRKIRFLMSLPIARSLFSKWMTREFAGELGSLLQSGLSMQDALEVLEKQKINPVLSEIAMSVKGHVIYGENFDSAIRLTHGLRDELSAYAKHGSDSGYLAKELLLFSENLHELIEEDMGKCLALLQPVLFTILAFCILAAYLALLLPVYSMFDNL